MKKKLLTIEDLIKFCKEQKMFSFSSKNNGEPICIAIPATFEKSDEKSSSLLFADIKAFHTGRNLNGSAVTEDAMTGAKKTFAYKPILAAFTTDKNGDEDFMSHEMEIDEDGNVVYIEKQVGTFTVDEPWTETDPDDSEKTWVFARCAIPREYTHAADIIERKGGTRVSVELYVNEFAYDEKEDLLLLKDIEVSGLTLLGVYEEGADPETDYVREGMKGARLDISDFSRQNNSSINYEELTDVIKDVVIKTLQDINTQGKEENNQMNHFEELLQKYGKTVEEIAFAYEGLSDEELDAAFADAFETAPEPENPENQDNNSQLSEPQTDEPQSENVEFSVTYKGETKTFAKSLNDKIKEITELINATYGYEDNAYYDCEVFDETKTVLFHDWWNGKHFRQKYGTKEGNLALKGERTEVFVRYLSEDELAALDELNSKFESVSKNYEEASKELSLYKEEPNKVALLESADYSSIKDFKEYEELSKRENYFSLSTDEVKAKLDGLLLEFAKKAGHESKPEKKPEKYPCKRYGFGTVKENCNSRYGGIFDKEK